LAQVPASLARADDIAVYAVVLDSLFGSPPAGARRLLVLGDSTKIYRRENLVREFWTDLYQMVDIDSSAVADLERRARAALPTRAFGDSLGGRLSSRLQFVSDSTLRAMPRTGIAPAGRFMSSADYFWQAFYEKFPGAVGTVSLSPVGYSRDGAQAVVYVEHGCGSLCGEGRIVLLRRRLGAWHIVATRQTWVS
jgi:hypothetical protein